MLCACDRKFSFQLLSRGARAASHQRAAMDPMCSVTASLRWIGGIHELRKAKNCCHPSYNDNLTRPSIAFSQHPLTTPSTTPPSWVSHTSAYARSHRTPANTSGGSERQDADRLNRSGRTTTSPRPSCAALTPSTSISLASPVAGMQSAIPPPTSSIPPLTDNPTNTTLPHHQRPRNRP